MGKRTVVLETALSENEKQKLKTLVKGKTQEIYKKIQDEYPDDYNKTIMMDDEVTQAKNEILRKIKFFKQKQLTLPNFIRKSKQDIIAAREPKDMEGMKKDFLKATERRKQEKSQRGDQSTATKKNSDRDHLNLPS